MRVVYLAAGHACAGLGLVGIFVPLLPTTPFLLLALFFYSRSSQRLHDWLLNHPRAGGALRAWNEHGVIRPRAKALALMALWGSIVGSITWGGISRAGAIGLAVLAMLLSIFLFDQTLAAVRLNPAKS